MLKVYNPKHYIHRLIGPICLICKQKCRASDTLRQQCLTLLSLRKLASDYCLRCGIDLYTSTQQTTDAAIRCADCIAGPPLFDRCIAAVSYNPIAGKLVNNLKHRSQLAAAYTMAELMAITVLDRYQDLHRQIDTIVPVPLSARRLQQRGFNQALEISRLVSQKLAIPLAAHSCYKILDTPAQQLLGLRERNNNLDDAFKVRNPAAIHCKKIAIIDDVVTTTTTANSLAAVLLEAGADSCDVWCFARTPSPQQAN